MILKCTVIFATGMIAKPTQFSVRRRIRKLRRERIGVSYMKNPEWRNGYSAIYGFNVQGEYVDHLIHRPTYVVGRHRQSGELHFIAHDWLNVPHRYEFSQMDDHVAYTTMLSLVASGQTLKALECE